MALQTINITAIESPYTVQCSAIPEDNFEPSATEASLSSCIITVTTTKYQGLVSAETTEIFKLVVAVYLIQLVCLFGIFSNVINIIIFYKQGLTTTINISFFALAISDMFAVGTLAWSTILLNPLFIQAMPQWDTLPVIYITTTWPHLSFGRITCWITTYITGERCLCIAMPLKVKQIITARRTTFIVCFLYFINLSTMVPIYFGSYLDWVVVPGKNKTMLTLVATESRSKIYPVNFVISAVLGTSSFPIVILFTAILVYKLRRQKTWRMKSANNQNRKEMASKREVQTMNMAVLIAVVLIACYTPGILSSIVTSLVPSFDIVGTEVNLYTCVFSVVALCSALNSSVNIFLYYRMSSNYKQTFRKLFSCCKARELSVGNSRKQPVVKD